MCLSEGLLMCVQLGGRLSIKQSNFTNLLDPLTLILLRRGTSSCATINRGPSRRLLLIDLIKCDSSIAKYSSSRDPGLSPEERVDLATKYFCSRLGATEKYIATIRLRYPILFRLDLRRVEKVLDLLETNGVSAEVILRNMYLLRHTEKRLMERVELMRREGIAVIPWLLHCPRDTLDKHIANWTSKVATIKPHNGIVGYLSERLECSEEEIRELAKKHPRLLTLNASKMEKILNLLYDRGYTSAQVLCLSNVC